MSELILEWEEEDLIEISNKLAMLVGVNKYLDSSFSDLNFCENDVSETYELLLDSGSGQYLEENVHLLINNTIEPTRNNIISRLYTISRSAGPEDCILFYFSGHGLVNDGVTYLLPSNAFINSLEDTAVQLDLIKKIMKESLARVKILIFDSCHSGAIKGAKDSGIMTEDMYQAIFPPPEGFVVLSSCKQSEFSYEWPEKEHGVFSYFLLEGLRGKADRNEDGIITVSDAYFYTTEKVKEWAFSKGIKQSPIYEAKITGDIPFVISKEKKEEEVIIDKSVINNIHLVSIIYTNEIERDSTIQKICGGFLEYFRPVDIKRLNDSHIEFPYGRIKLAYYGRADDSSLYLFNILINYVKENWIEIDKLILDLDAAFYWRQLSYELIAPINFEKLVSKCKETGFRILEFEPSENNEQLTVESSGWANTITTFQNSEETSKVIFKPRKEDRNRFPGTIYDTINPNNIMTFLKEIIKDVS